MVARGDVVAYRAIAGDTWDAKVTAVGPGEKFVDIAVMIPGVAEPWPLRAVRWWPDVDEPTPGARPRREVHGA
jgi:hypothetical protein